jgi:hypothetical protein
MSSQPRPRRMQPLSTRPVSGDLGSTCLWILTCCGLCGNGYEYENLNHSRTDRSRGISMHTTKKKSNRRSSGIYTIDDDGFDDADDIDFDMEDMTYSDEASRLEEELLNELLEVKNEVVDPQKLQHAHQLCSRVIHAVNQHDFSDSFSGKLSETAIKVWRHVRLFSVPLPSPLSLPLSLSPSLPTPLSMFTLCMHCITQSICILSIFTSGFLSLELNV